MAVLKSGWDRFSESLVITMRLHILGARDYPGGWYAQRSSLTDD